jgi:hypothetical protein
MNEWNRHQLWPAADAARNAFRAWSRMLWLVSSVVVATFALATPPTASNHADDQRIEPANPAARECQTDADCVLLPALVTCCGECDPEPPFEAIPRSTLEQLRSDTDEQCAPRTRLCEPPQCFSADRRARAECRNGTCRAVTSEPYANP